MDIESSDAAGMSILSKAERVIAVLQDTGTTSAASLADRLSEPVSSIHRLIRTMENAGWLERAETRGAYRLGPWFIRIGQLVEESLDVRRLARRSLEVLHRATGESTYLCIRSGPRAVCIDRIDGVLIQSFEFPLGGSMPLHQGAAPRLLLAFQPPDVRERYFDELASAAANPLLPGERLRISQELDAIRDTGVAVSDGDVIPGTLTAAAAIFDHRGGVIAALAASALAARVADRRAFIDEVVRSAQSVSAALGLETDRVRAG